ncbi:MAG: hypothetical protein GY859_43875, partial [Desulfobacterales bacterium]|nr:hypothetical protein [Desulfobacterales bacterium]
MHPLTNLHKKAPAFPKCPVTGLPIREKPEWTDVELGENYKLTLRVLGENIILGRPEGCPVLYEQKAALNLLDEVAAGLAGEDRRYIYIVDLENARGCTRQARECYVEHMKNQPRLLGLIFISAPFMFKFFIKLAKAARRLHVNPGFTVDHEAAVQLALEMLSAGASPRDKASGAGRGGPAPPGSAPRREVVSNEEWRLQIGEYSLEAEMINGNILHSLSSGSLGVEHIEPIEALRLKVNNAPHPPGGVDYFIVGVKDLKMLNWRARRIYMESLKRWHAFRPIRMYISYGVNTFTRAAVSLAAPFLPFKLGIADDLESALEIVENHKKNRQKGSARAAGTAPTEE